MAPTLNAGDDILVDLGDATERLRDGINALRIDDALIVKRVALDPLARGITVQSDNPAYADWPDCSLSDLDAIWARHLVRPTEALGATAIVHQPG